MIDNENSGTTRPPRVARSQWPPEQWAGVMMTPILVVFVLVFIPLFIWFGCRIEPKAGEIAVLIKKTGEDLPSGQILALKPEQKGIQLDVLAEGRTFRNPYAWAWSYWPITDIPAGKLGVKTRLYGDDLPSGEIIAHENTKGIVAEVLTPGRYRINPYAFNVKMSDAVNIHPGCVGVKVSLVGRDILNDKNIPAEQRNTFLVADGMKGAQEDVLNPGTYYLNPFMYDVVEVNLQSQRFAVSGDGAINFLTMDGFTVVVEGTIEFAIQREKAAFLTHRVGDMNDIVQKLIVPRMRGFCRIEGSKHPAINFIVGQTRQQFQTDLEKHLRSNCDEWGVSIKSVLIRNIIPPDQIASIIRDRQVAVQESLKYDQEIKQAISKAELVKQETLAQQNKEKVEADTVRIRAVINADQEQDVRIIAANKDMDVAKVENEAAVAQAKAILFKAQADADVIRMQNIAQAGVIKNQVKAFSTGQNFARYTFYTKIGPDIESILTSDQEQGLGTLFLPFLPQGKELK